MLEFGAKTPWDGDMLQAEHSESIGNWKVASGKIRILIEKRIAKNYSFYLYAEKEIILLSYFCFETDLNGWITDKLKCLNGAFW